MGVLDAFQVAVNGNHDLATHRFKPGHLVDGGLHPVGNLRGTLPHLPGGGLQLGHAVRKLLGSLLTIGEGGGYIVGAAGDFAHPVDKLLSAAGEQTGLGTGLTRRAAGVDKHGIVNNGWGPGAGGAV